MALPSPTTLPSPTLLPGTAAAVPRPVHIRVWKVSGPYRVPQEPDTERRG